MPNRILRCGRFELRLRGPLIMGIVNITPDSFSDGGRFLAARSAIEQAQRLIDEGAHIVDLGAESSRPGADPVPLDEEWRRLIPVLDGLRNVAVPISVDTCKTEVMRRAIDSGASMVNDITALAAPGSMAVLAASDAAVCLMHMQGEPRTMQIAPRYDDVVAEVGQWLQTRIEYALEAGIARERIVIDPGFGFGKTTEHNLQLLRNLRHLAAFGYPVLAKRC
jgi:dihydropteroate synthase